MSVTGLLSSVPVVAVLLSSHLEMELLGCGEKCHSVGYGYILEAKILEAWNIELITSSPHS